MACHLLKVFLNTSNTKHLGFSLSTDRRRSFGLHHAIKKISRGFFALGIIGGDGEEKIRHIYMFYIGPGVFRGGECNVFIRPP